MVRFKQLLKVLFLTEEHIIHNAYSPGNTYLLTGHFSLINAFTVLKRRAWGVPPAPGQGVKCLPLINKASWLMVILWSTHYPENL